MKNNYLMLYVFGTLAYFIARAVAHEAIVGGKAADIKEFGYMVLLYEVGFGHICGGTIIGRQFILTAAHCFVNPDNSFKSKRIYAIPARNAEQSLELLDGSIEAVKIYIPKEYKIADTSTTGDIAVLKLAQPFQFAFIDSLKMARIEKNQQGNYTGKKGTIAGWGSNKIELKDNREVGRRTDASLRFATSDILSHHQCELDHPHLTISEKHLCARVEQRDHEIRGVCYGDDGGSLVHDDVVIGVLSRYLNGCRERKNAAIYTRVSHYLTFIANCKIDYVTKYMRAHELL